MVTHPRTPPRPRAVRALDAPQPVEVRVSAAGHPAAIRLRRWTAVREVQDIWRLDEEWWREQPVSRMYYRVALSDGTVEVLYKDLVSKTWFRQKA